MFTRHLYFFALSRAERSVCRGSKQIVTAQGVRKRRKKMTNIREKISGRKNLIIAGALIALMAIGSTLAYFVDRDQVTNHFTVGDIEISVSEPNWNPSDGADITPNKVVKKDPKITNDGANDAFVFMSVKVPKANVKTANADGTLNAAANQDLFTYSVNTGWKLIKTNASTDSTEYIYAYAGDKMTALKPGETTATIFDTVKFINIVEEQLDGQSLDIQVDTMGIQTADLGTDSPLEIYNIIMNQQDIPQ